MNAPAQFVYIIQRGDDLDVYADMADAERARDLLGADEHPIVEERVFLSSSEDPGTREWLDGLGTE